MLNNDLLQKYPSLFQKIKHGNTAFGTAPQKPVFLLAVIHRIEKGLFTDNRLYLTPNLETEFMEPFRLLAQMGNRPEYSLPFYHLVGEKF